jgi:acetylornithine deacetylase/succinyl-diaminopimelate desuccinylase-like protein
MGGRVEPRDVLRRAQTLWDTDVLPTLESYVRIPNLSPHFAPAWESDGHMDAAVELLADWCRTRPIDGIEVDVVRPPGLSPSIVVDIPAHGPEARKHDGPEVVIYGHMDKQPEFTGWREGLGPWEPVREGDRLYGRGTADDGYAVFAALTCIEAIRSAGGSHARCLVLIEGSEESGSPDLPATLDALADRIGQPSLVVSLDSGCPSYDRIWCTGSLRGLVAGTLTVRVLQQGVHSGSAGGVVPSSFRIARMLLSRIEDERTGEILLEELKVPIPPGATGDAEAVAKMVGEEAVGVFPVVEGLELTGDTTADRLMRRNWEPAMSVIGAEGFPSLVSAGNVLRPFTSLQLGFRLPPTCDSHAAARAIERALTADPPYGAEVTFELHSAADGWLAPELGKWLDSAVDTASIGCFGMPFGIVGEGGTIPFMGMLGERFGHAQILATGVLGPGSNAHGPNEYLDLPMAVKLTASIGLVLDDQTRHRDI